METRNAGATISVQGIGQTRRQEILVTQEHRDNQSRPLTSPLTVQTLAAGGWVRWTPQRESKGHRRQRSGNVLQFAAPGFDLYAIVGRREVLAWANDWDTGAPVAGAQIELLWLTESSHRPAVVTRGKTGPDGVAVLQLPDDIAIPEPDDNDTSVSSWLLRASHGVRSATSRAVLLFPPRAMGKRVQPKSE